MEPLWSACAERDARDAADGLADVVHPVETERIEEGDDVVGQEFDRPGLVAGSRSAVRSHVATDDPPIAREVGDPGPPVLAVAPEARLYQHGRG